MAIIMKVGGVLIGNRVTTDGLHKVVTADVQLKVMFLISHNFTVAWQPKSHMQYVECLL